MVLLLVHLIHNIGYLIHNIGNGRQCQPLAMAHKFQKAKPSFIQNIMPIYTARSAVTNLLVTKEMVSKCSANDAKLMLVVDGLPQHHSHAGP